MGDMDKDGPFRNTLKPALLKGPPRPRRRVPPFLRSLITGVQATVDWALPPRCALCSDMIGGMAGLCGSCFATMQFLTDPLCEQCGRPTSVKETSSTCATCLTAPPRYDWLRAAFAYDDASRSLILALKYRDRLDVVPALAGWMAAAAMPKIEAGDIIMPVPLHWRRFLARRFNQSAALAMALAERSDGIYAPDWIERTRNTPPMKAMTRKQRAENVLGAFSIAPPRRDVLHGRGVVLVDDVFTSGATIEELSAELRVCGVSRIGVVVVARVVKHTHFQQEFELE